MLQNTKTADNSEYTRCQQFAET